MKDSAIAIFVKTPGFSPIKTRLAIGVGESKALEFYNLSVSSITEVILSGLSNTRSQIIPFWAVAEKSPQALEIWTNFEIVVQSGESLGERLHHVYSTLRDKFENVILIGADSPQLTFGLITQADQILREAKSNLPTIVFGPARDGGFYLFAGNCNIPMEVWTSVEYSRSQTTKDLKRQLGPGIQTTDLEMLSDVDCVDDLLVLNAELSKLPSKVENQKFLERWLQHEIK